MARLKLYVFGTPRLEHDSQPIELNLRKALALLVYLAATGQPHSRDALATLLWPEGDQSEGRARLRRTLHRLNLALGETILDASGDSIRLHPDADLWIDSAAFRRHVTAGLPAAPDAALAPERVAHLADAVALYADDFLSGFTLPDSPAFDEWQFFQRESLRQLYGQVLEQLVAAYRSQSAWDQAILYARRWVALDPLHEPAHRTLMRLYAWAGQAAAAARQYQECARILADELGVEPEEETTALYQAIRTRQLARPFAAEPRPQQRDLAEVPATGVQEKAGPGRDRFAGEGRAGPAQAAAWEPGEGETREREQRIHFCATPDGVRIAYAVAGAGPALVKAANWLSHLEFDWQSPVWQHWLAGLAERNTLVRYDERGGGLSDWNVDDFSLDAWVRDLELVVDSLGLERFPLLGMSQGGPVAIAYAVRHPERVSHLILYGSYVQGRMKRTPSEREEAELYLKLAGLGWGKEVAAFRKVFAATFIPEGTAEQMQWFDDLQRVSTSPENAVRFLQAFYQIDVSDLARQVTAPTLVLHARADARVPFDTGRQLAALIPGARFVSLDSRNHILLEHEPAWGQFLSEVRRFLESEPDARHGLPAPKAEPARAAELRPPHNLPAQATSFVGRERELADLARRLRDPDCRLLTLCGPGGMGKTRLALAAAGAQLRGDSPFVDGVFFVELAPLSAAAEIVLAIATAIGFAFYTEQPPLQQLNDYLRQKRMLIVLDNFEHLLGSESARLSVGLLEAAPGVKLLATSRVMLNIQGEHAILLEGLPAPDSQPDAGDSAESADDAVRLFVERARRVRPDFVLSPANQASVFRICRLVQGMPLGIELAAAWLGVLSPAEIAAEIEQSIDFLEAEWRDAPERHQSLRAVFDASWQLLTEQQRAALGALTVFQGSFTRDAAEAVADVPPKMLRALTHASWLQRDDDGRFKIHELLRQYAGEKIQADPAAWERCRQRHGAYFAEWLARHEQHLKGPRPEEACAAIMREVDNLRAAWHWLVAQGQSEAAIRQMLPAMFHACEAQFRAFALLPLLEAAQAALAGDNRADDRQQLAILLTVQGAFLRTGTPLRTQGLDIGPAYEDAIRRAWALAGTPDQLRAIDVWGVLLAAVYGWTIEGQAGIHELRQLIPHLREQRQPWTLGFALQLLGRLLYMRLPDEAPDAVLAEADRHLSEALAIFESCGDERESGNSLRLRGVVRLLQRRLPDASADLQAAQARLEGISDWANAANVSWQLADVHFLLGETRAAFEALRRMSEAYAARGHQTAAINALSRESYEAVRYSTIEHARATRERCLALARQTGDAIAEAWSSWEMGELERVAGDAAAAREWYERAGALFERVRDPFGPLFYQRGLADLAHAAGDFAEARRRFADSAAQIREGAHDWAAAYALAGLARVALAQGEAAPAQPALAEALAKARKNVDAGIALVVLSGIAGLRAALGQHEQAVELAALVAEHPATWHETKAQAAAVLASAAATLTAERRAQAEARGRARDFWQTIDELTGELAQLIPPPEVAASPSTANSLPAPATSPLLRLRERGAGR
ncbi:MAG: alpha/beta fold hydrolase [Kouleothrix sp.]|nr:alpha/beta fold hydrolase [Kouleothrix sp.]